MKYLVNPLRDTSWAPEPGLEAQARAFHEAQPDYAPTALVSLDAVADQLELGRVLVKDESSRFGLPAFKALGAFWAASWAVEQSGRDPGELTLVAATEGNHGRAVAAAARRLGARAHIVIPRHTSPARAAGIESEGAHVERVDGGYEDAVARSAELADAEGGAAAPGGAPAPGGAAAPDGVAARDRLVISDTSWPGYTEIPARVVEGYATMFAEIETDVDVVLVPIGVGSLAAAAARHYRPGATTLIGVEPDDAACALESARAGHMVTLPGPFPSTMAGLNCAEPSAAAWPLLAAAYDAFCSVEDEYVDQGLRLLAEHGLDRGASSGGVVGALLAHRDRLPDGASVLLIATEGVTDPAVFEAAVGRPQRVV